MKDLKCNWTPPLGFDEIKHKYWHPDISLFIYGEYTWVLVSAVLSAKTIEVTLIHLGANSDNILKGDLPIFDSQIKV